MRRGARRRESSCLYKSVNDKSVNDETFCSEGYLGFVRTAARASEGHPIESCHNHSTTLSMGFVRIMRGSPHLQGGLDAAALRQPAREAADDDYQARGSFLLQERVETAGHTSVRHGEEPLPSPFSPSSDGRLSPPPLETLRIALTSLLLPHALL